MERVERAAPAPIPPRKAPAAKKAPVVRAPAVKKAASKVFASDDELDAILEAVPALLSGEQVPLNDVTRQLREAKVLGRSAKSTTLLGRHADDFRLTPERNPAYVQWMARTGR